MKYNKELFDSPEQQFGTTFESLMERRERVATSEGVSFGASKMFPELARRIMMQLPQSAEPKDYKARILEVDAGAGLFTRVLLNKGYAVTAIEPTPMLLRHLKKINNEHLEVEQGFVEELFFSDLQIGGESAPFDAAVVSFPARRGRGILSLICQLLHLVNDKIILILPDDGSVDWSSTMRSITLKGYDVRTEFVADLPAIERAKESAQLDLGQIRRVMMMTVNATPVVDSPLSSSQVINAWGASIRVIEVPYPVPRGAATRLIRYFKAGGDRSILIKTEEDGMNQLYGNLRTAAHRIARDLISVRRVDTGIQLMQMVHREMPGKD